MQETKQTTILQKLANATKTYYNCSGHSKADRNEKICKEYKEQLTSSGINIPTDDELLKIGEFNGDGSY